MNLPLGELLFYIFIKLYFLLQLIQFKVFLKI
jgi:hypothetical protein